jgi:hypothetical protein
MWNTMWKLGGQMMEAFIPGVGKTMIPVTNIEKAKAATPGLIMGSIMSGYKSIKDIKKECANPPSEPVFILSRNRVWRKRVGRILYGTEEEDYFL